MNLTEIKLNPNNPRLIKDASFEKLVNSIKEFPKMMELRPIVVDSDGVILGGNMRFRALKELGYKDIPDEWVKRADELTDDEKRRFIAVDNVGFGEWDWDIVANEWDSEELDGWGVEVPEANGSNYSDESENIEIEKAKELDFYEEFVIIKFKDEEKYNEFIIKYNIPHVQTSSMNNGKDIRTNFKRVFDYEDLHTIIE